MAGDLLLLTFAVACSSADSRYKPPRPPLRPVFQPVDPATGADLPVKALVFMTHGYGSDSGWLFQKIAIAYATWGYAVHCADLLGHGRSGGIRCYLGDMESVAAASLSFFLSVRRESLGLPAFLFG
ncbi:hypothetical protein B296_00037636 [Ensete ventricosum]|uniref:Serine aminopeptidase S33 domain-containing protein n=1 Tax=Ensete ventricosum TaxID=4639 RepID=A0A426ZZ20_ENSVE|nr:hypothetical protein B296_00037636 [Ensete ventricosum]